MAVDNSMIQPTLVGDRLLITLRDGETLTLGPGLVAPGRDFSHCDLSMVKLDGSNLDGCRFEGSDLTYVDFSNASLVGAEFVNCVLVDVIFIRSGLQNAVFSLNEPAERIRCEQADFSYAKFQGPSRIEGSKFTDASFFGAQFENVELQGVGFNSCELTGCRFLDVEFNEVTFHNAEAVLASFETCTFDDVELYHAVLNGARFEKCVIGNWGVEFNYSNLQNSHFTDCRFGKGSVIGFHAQGVDFRGASFCRSQFMGGNFFGAGFGGVKIVSCGFNETNQSHSAWDNATILNSRFRFCEFDESTMQNTKFVNCSLQEAVFDEAKSRAATFEGCDFGPSIPVRKDEAA